ncbi:hypothetical protein NDN01_24945 [Sphingomonas sp. QA11]|uniref:hypothetical protein n=1 Tax=Sphingomonas sp. QA11 TaxID=2950605 RepID=UPI002348FF6E|nr:hypothetical protein [Sphingomonas sp. QA11]WCM27191.1 hypothetical protein NDN01_24945 [Sphingomonas sp. QA11]
MRSTTQPAIFVTLCAALLSVALTFVPTKQSAAATPGIDRPATMLHAALRSMNPCLNGTNQRPDCLIFEIEPEVSPAPIDRMEMNPILFNFAEDAVTRIRVEVPPAFFQAMNYLFPHWPRSREWLTQALENTRHSGCPRMAHIREVWVIVRPGVATETDVYADVMITRADMEVEKWRRLDHLACNDGPVIVEEIK